MNWKGGGIGKWLILVMIAFFLSACIPSIRVQVLAPEFEGGNSVAAVTSPIPNGDSVCPDGGVMIQAGIDSNNSKTLDASESGFTGRLCNSVVGEGLAQQWGLAKLELFVIHAGSQCAVGGVGLKVGIDLNYDEKQVDSEHIETKMICNEVQAIAKEAEPEVLEDPGK